jgi:6-phosphogluconolactonase (cycloisomerase 2 family)
MKLSWMGRIAMATLASLALGLGMSACGGGTIGYIWVLGDQFNQITGFKVDDFTGNLTQVIGSPFTSNGVNPVSIVIKPGGRYIYVINQGTGGGIVNGAFQKETSGGIALYSVGGDGVLTFQQSYATQGAIPSWAQMDSGGSFLYVLDKQSPDINAVSTAGQHVGSITAFTIDASTGRLTLVTNHQVNDTSGNPTTFFNVGASPFMMKTAGGCLLTLDSDNTVFPYAFGGNGQITVTTPGFLPVGSGALSKLTSINGNGSNIFITDAGTNQILPYTIGSQCSLTSLAGGVTPNQTGTSNPMYSMVDNSGKYLYVLNQSTTVTNPPTTPFSSISAFTLSPSSGQLAPIAGSPYKVGSNPVCIVEDSSNQYIYTSNRNDGTVSGFVLDPTTGELSSLTRGSTFTASGLGSCLALSGAVD